MRIREIFEVRTSYLIMYTWKRTCGKIKHVEYFLVYSFYLTKVSVLINAFLTISSCDTIGANNLVDLFS